ncbi:MAG TPA: hypothetical protein VG897_07020 [Terriglobales bacterium]|nr:hypothetical protein [Terriglobales bacterium]
MQFRRREESLHAFEELALFFANVFAQGCGKDLEIGNRELPDTGTFHITAQKSVFDPQFINELLQFVVLVRRRKQNFLFGGKVKRNFLIVQLHDLRFPVMNVRCVMHFGKSFPDANTQR